MGQEIKRSARGELFKGWKAIKGGMERNGEERRAVKGEPRKGKRVNDKGQETEA